MGLWRGKVGASSLGWEPGPAIRHSESSRQSVKLWARKWTPCTLQQWESVDLFPAVLSRTNRPQLLAALGPEDFQNYLSLSCFRVWCSCFLLAQGSLDGKARPLWSMWCAWSPNPNPPGSLKKSSFFSEKKCTSLSQEGQIIFKCRKTIPICWGSHCRKSPFQRLLL